VEVAYGDKRSLVQSWRPEEWEKCPSFLKVAKTVAEPKKAKISTSKLNLKVQNIYIKHFETLKYLQQIVF
jgi:hypothetical protein